MNRHLARRTLALLTAMLATVATSTIAASPASAALPTVCKASRFCLWKNPNRQGPVAAYGGSNIGHGTPVAPSFAGQASSLWNRTGNTIRVYVSDYCMGASEDIAPGVYVPNIARTPFYYMDDNIRSLRIYGYGFSFC